MPDEDRWLNTEDVARRYSTNASTVRSWRYYGTGPQGVRFGGRTLYRESECERWEQEKEQAEKAARGAA
jgi:hypothetical protein